MKAALVAATLAATVTPVAAGPCLVDGLAPQILTPTGAVIDQFGGVVVAAVSSPFEQHRADRGDPSAQTSWQFRRGAKRARAKITQLAPGLALYAPAGDLGMVKKLALEDTKDHTAVEVELGFMDTDDMPMDEAPKVTAITHTTNTPMLRTETTVATLSAPPPAGTVALLVFDASSKGKLARSFVLVDNPAATSITIYGRHRCEAEVPGTVPTRAGARIRLAWVDAEGHVSLRSEPVKVAKIK